MKNLLLSAFALILIIFSSCVAEVVTPIQKTTFQDTDMDTTILFDPVTFEETIVLVKSKSSEQTAKETEEGIVQVDTIITFDSETFEETIEIVRTRVKNGKTKNN